MVSGELQQAGGAGGGIGEVGIEEAPAVLDLVIGAEVVPAEAEVEGELVVHLPVVADVGGGEAIAAAEFADGLEADGGRTADCAEHEAGEGVAGGAVGAQVVRVGGVLRGGVGVEGEFDQA